MLHSLFTYLLIVNSNNYSVWRYFGPQDRNAHASRRAW